MVCNDSNTAMCSFWWDGFFVALSSLTNLMSSKYSKWGVNAQSIWNCPLNNVKKRFKVRKKSFSATINQFFKPFVRILLITASLTDILVTSSLCHTLYVTSLLSATRRFDFKRILLRVNSCLFFQSLLCIYTRTITTILYRTLICRCVTFFI